MARATINGQPYAYTRLRVTYFHEVDPSAQGFADLVMGLAGASAGALSGVIVGAWGYPVLTLLAAAAASGLIAAVALSRR